MKFKYLYGLILLSAFTFGCVGKRVDQKKKIVFKYEITGTVPLESGGTHPAVWLTDSFTVDSCGTIRILNSDGSVYNIEPPYTVTRIQD
jgi:hypothetical protein